MLILQCTRIKAAIYIYAYNMCDTVLSAFFFNVKNPEKDLPTADPSGAMPRLNTVYVLYNSTP